MDKAISIDELRAIHRKAVFEYANEMVEIKTSTILKKLRLSLDYIYDHLNERIRLSDIIEYVGVSESQLRRDFQVYLKITPSAYINEKKINLQKISFYIQMFLMWIWQMIWVLYSIVVFSNFLSSIWA